MASKSQKEAQLERDWEEAIKNAVYVANDVDLKTAIGKKSLVIISTDMALYSRLLKKVPKEKVSAGSKVLGKILIGLGAAISILSFGAFAFIGVPIAGAGAVLGTVGIALDECKDYSLFLNYDKKEVMFVKIKGTPCLPLPKHISPKKLTAG